jgi:eukaryotic-like serine/threonine-protein kinase
MIGQSIGRYEIIERLGEGGMGVVYKAVDSRPNRHVAIKFIRSTALPLETLNIIRRRFDREAHSLAMLSHPNIVQVLDYGEHEGVPYIIMPYYPDGTLRSKLGTKFPFTEAARLLMPIARSLDYAHAQGIIHRDVKPSNLLISAAGELILSDFGIAHRFSEIRETTLTGTGREIGTPEYMAPEQAMGEKVDHRADVYALGIGDCNLKTQSSMMEKWIGLSAYEVYKYQLSKKQRKLIKSMMTRRDLYSP